MEDKTVAQLTYKPGSQQIAAVYEMLLSILSTAGIRCAIGLMVSNPPKGVKVEKGSWRLEPRASNRGLAMLLWPEESGKAYMAVLHSQDQLKLMAELCPRQSATPQPKVPRSETPEGLAEIDVMINRLNAIKLPITMLYEIVHDGRGPILSISQMAKMFASNAANLRVTGEYYSFEEFTRDYLVVKGHKAYPKPEKLEQFAQLLVDDPEKSLLVKHLHSGCLMMLWSIVTAKSPKAKHQIRMRLASEFLDTVTLWLASQSKIEPELPDWPPTQNLGEEPKTPEPSGEAMEFWTYPNLFDPADVSSVALVELWLDIPAFHRRPDSDSDEDVIYLSEAVPA